MNHSLASNQGAIPATNKFEPSEREVEPSRPTTKKRITVLLVDNFTIVRQGLRLLIEAGGDIEVVGEAKTEREAVQMTRDLRPEIVVMDIVMPFLCGSQTTRQILKAYPATKVLILSTHSDPEYVERLAKAGASGYVVKEASGDVLAHAIRELQMGKTYFSPSIAKRLKDEHQKFENGAGLPKKRVAELSSREAELLPLIAEGHVNKEIASELGISIKTVEKHRQHLMRKLNIHHIAGLTHFAIASGIIECSVQSLSSFFKPSAASTGTAAPGYFLA